MRSRVQDKIEVINLRMQGYSYKQIMEKVSVSKSLISGWLKYVKLSQEQEKDLFEKIRVRSNEGRAKSVSTNRGKRMQREADAFAEARKVYEKHKSDPIFPLGITLYWAEGSKRSTAFQFVNSDPKMITFMIYWTIKYFSIEKEDISLRVNTHADFKNENYEDFWSKTTGIPPEQFKRTVYKPNRHGIYKKNPNYKGCIRLELKGGMALLRKMISLQNILISDLEMLYFQSDI